MPEQTIELSGIIARLERVEKENRRLKGVGIVLLLGVCAVVLMGQAQAGRTVEAERFILRDQDGKMRAELSAENPYESSLKFYDKDGKKGTYYSNWSLQVVDMWGKGLTHLGPDDFSMFAPDVTNGDVMIRPTYLQISGKAGSVSLGMVPTFLGGTARLASFMSMGESAPGLILNGALGKGFVSMNTGDGPLLHMEGLLGESPQPLGSVDIAAGKRLNTSAASVVLSGKGRVLWSAP